MFARSGASLLFLTSCPWSASRCATRNVRARGHELCYLIAVVGEALRPLLGTLNAWFFRHISTSAICRPTSSPPSTLASDVSTTVADKAQDVQCGTWAQGIDLRPHLSVLPPFLRSLIGRRGAWGSSPSSLPALPPFDPATSLSLVSSSGGLVMAGAPCACEHARDPRCARLSCARGATAVCAFGHASTSSHRLTGGVDDRSDAGTRAGHREGHPLLAVQPLAQRSQDSSRHRGRLPASIRIGADGVGFGAPPVDPQPRISFAWAESLAASCSWPLHVAGVLVLKPPNWSGVGCFLVNFLACPGSTPHTPTLVAGKWEAIGSRAAGTQTRFACFIYWSGWFWHGEQAAGLGEHSWIFQGPCTAPYGSAHASSGAKRGKPAPRHRRVPQSIGNGRCFSLASNSGSFVSAIGFAGCRHTSKTTPIASFSPPVTS